MNHVAETIYQQLGGNRFVAMTGAKLHSSESDHIVFKLPRNFAKVGINAFRVLLDPTDTYTVTFYKQKGAPSFEVKKVHELEGVYADQLQAVFKEVTGLDTRL